MGNLHGNILTSERNDYRKKMLSTQHIPYQQELVFKFKRFLTIIFLILIAIIIYNPIFTTAGITANTSDIVLFNVDTNNQINLESDVSMFSDYSIALSPLYAIWIADKVTIKIFNLSSNEISVIKTEWRVSGVSVSKQNLAYYQSDGIYIYNISMKETARIYHGHSVLYIQIYDNNLLFIDYSEGIETMKNINLINNQITNLGNVTQHKVPFALLHNNSVLYSKYYPDSRNSAVILYNLVNFSTETLFLCDCKVNAIALQDKFAAWQFENGTVFLQNRNTKNIDIANLGDYHSTWSFSSDNKSIVYVNTDFKTREIFIYNTSLKKNTRLTYTNNFNEQYPIIHGDYILWDAVHINENFLGHGAFIQFCTSICIIARFRK